MQANNTSQIRKELQTILPIFKTWSNTDIFEFIIDCILTAFKLSPEQKNCVDQYSIDDIKLVEVNDAYNGDTIELTISHDKSGDTKTIRASIHKIGNGRFYI